MNAQLMNRPPNRGKPEVTIHQSLPLVHEPDRPALRPGLEPALLAQQCQQSGRRRGLLGQQPALALHQGEIPGREIVQPRQRPFDLGRQGIDGGLQQPGEQPLPLCRGQVIEPQLAVEAP